MPAIYRQIRTEEFRSLEPGDDVYVTKEDAKKIFPGIKSVWRMPDYIRCLFLKTIDDVPIESAYVRLEDNHFEAHPNSDVSILEIYEAVYATSFPLPDIKDISSEKGINNLFPGDIVYISSKTFSSYIGIKAGFEPWTGTEKVECKVVQCIYRTDLVEITLIDRDFTYKDCTIRVHFNELIIP